MFAGFCGKTIHPQHLHHAQALLGDSAQQLRSSYTQRGRQSTSHRAGARTLTLHLIHSYLIPHTQLVTSLVIRLVSSPSVLQLDCSDC